MTQEQIATALASILAAISADAPPQHEIDAAGGLGVALAAQALADLHRIAAALERIAAGAPLPPAVEFIGGAP